MISTRLALWLRKASLAACLSLLVALVPATGLAEALGSQDNPQSGSIGLEAKISSPAPTQAASIGTPSSGQTFTSTPITVAGLCPASVLIKIFSNNIFVGSAACQNGSYSLKVDLFGGRNDLVARVFDALDQQGPDSSIVTVNFRDAQILQFGSRVNITSVYARRGADPGQELDWPITLSGGTPPYALSVDWGDSKSPDLMSVTTPGDVTVKHVYDSAGLYTVIIKATDRNGTVAFLQLVGVGNGQIAGTGTGGNGSGTGSGGVPVITKTSVEWWPAAVLLPLVGVAFWLGRRHELFTIRRQLDQSRVDGR